TDECDPNNLKPVDIAEIIEQVMNQVDSRDATSIDAFIEDDVRAREHARKIIFTEERTRERVH
ncbi:MAG: hypothetical protein ACC663_13360, partial [Gammaproteobacteria bacterium]